MSYQPDLIFYFLRSMVKACVRIQQHVSGMSFEQFIADRKTTDAVERQFQVLGECSRKIPFRVQKKFKKIPWSSMHRLRNRISHEFYDVDAEMLWCIIQNDLEKNLAELQEIASNPAALQFLSNPVRKTKY
ncbi:MAG: DUF86 domain-containing protein [Flavobacteriales bacterium]|nr:DUF86 domain-containing protein [Flavobacteriales bacterium]